VVCNQFNSFLPARKFSPNPSRHFEVEKDEGISDEEDSAELKLQLELNEQVCCPFYAYIPKHEFSSHNFHPNQIQQETAVLRRKVEDLEMESESSKRQIEQLQEKIASEKKTPLAKKFGFNSKADVNDPLKEKKMQVMEDEINELRKKIIEKDREFDRMQAEMGLTKGKPKAGILKSK
jgi:hypothetical protein